MMAELNEHQEKYQGRESESEKNQVKELSKAEMEAVQGGSPRAVKHMDPIISVDIHWPPGVGPGS